MYNLYKLYAGFVHNDMEYGTSKSLVQEPRPLNCATACHASVITAILMLGVVLCGVSLFCLFFFQTQHWRVNFAVLQRWLMNAVPSAFPKFSMTEWSDYNDLIVGLFRLTLIVVMLAMAMIVRPGPLALHSMTQAVHMRRAAI
ncbi:hypothetical protein ROA7450_00783 [Roseovarius albus]|uniref:Uncharacterized protein n=1 Tax=Roseovarius albus TaxID=1247867 RepID=A0A1X6YJP8_9RHOB|nr:hypothetical protein ROA7450_00783 [Roseovarius albus]